jgi:hypothetical protein
VQNLFSNLPEVLQERKNSLSTPASMHSSKKRASPPTDITGVKANYSDPNIASPHNLRADQRGPGRARSFPHDLSVNISKRSSLSENASLTPRSFDEQDSSHHSAWNLGAANGIMTPTSTATPFSSQHLGNPNLPDMKPVMFPSDNPFAYPNQPMSTLEAQHVVNAEQTISYSSPATSSMYNLGGNNNQVPASLSFDNTRMPAFAGSFNVAQHFMQQGRQMSTPMDGAPSFGAPPQIEPVDLNAVNFPGGEGYWSQMDRVSGGRTGLTPGGINLDELFGGEGWSNIWNAQSFAR